jgi:putative transposase
MSRPLRIQYPNAVYHIMNRGLNRRPIFYDQRDYIKFFDLLEEAWKRWRIEIFAVCLMKNHYHLCLRTPEENLPRIMRHINGVYTQFFNRSRKRDGPLFKGRYKAILIEEQEYLSQVIRYIHLNPVAAKLVKNPQDFEWSTHKMYLHQSKTPDWFKKNCVKEWFGSAKSFQEYVLEGNDNFIENVYKKKRWPLVLGTQEFIDRVKKKSGLVTKENVRKDLEYVRPTLEQVLQAVGSVYNMPLTALVNGQRGLANEGRKVSQWLLREKCDFPYKEIAKIFGHGSIKTVSWACCEVRQLIESNKKTKSRLKKIERVLGN